jgi:hypothetical protein
MKRVLSRLLVLLFLLGTLLVIGASVTRPGPIIVGVALLAGYLLVMKLVVRGRSSDRSASRSNPSKYGVARWLPPLLLVLGLIAGLQTGSGIDSVVGPPLASVDVIERHAVTYGQDRYTESLRVEVDLSTLKVPQRVSLSPYEAHSKIVEAFAARGWEEQEVGTAIVFTFQAIEAKRLPWRSALPVHELQFEPVTIPGVKMIRSSASSVSLDVPAGFVARTYPQSKAIIDGGRDRFEIPLQSDRVRLTVTHPWSRPKPLLWFFDSFRSGLMNVLVAAAAFSIAFILKKELESRLEHVRKSLGKRPTGEGGEPWPKGEADRISRSMTLPPPIPGTRAEMGPAPSLGLAHKRPITGDVPDPN